MKRWQLIPVAGVVTAGLVWLAVGPERREAAYSAIKLAARLQPKANTKPICSSPVNPNVAAPTDCIPAHLANLPPDPGELGKLTIDGIDSDKDGVRDDVQRWIAENWGHSERAVKGLTLVALNKQLAVHYGDSLGKEETRKLEPALTRKIICYLKLETPEMLKASAFEKVQLKVTNTPERWKRSREFDYLFAHGVYELPNDTPKEACGFDPETLSN